MIYHHMFASVHDQDEFRRNMRSFEIISNKCSECMTVAKVALVMVSADERAFYVMNLIEHDMRNRLDRYAEARLLTYLQDMYSAATFPYTALEKQFEKA